MISSPRSSSSSARRATVTRPDRRSRGRSPKNAAPHFSEAHVSVVKINAITVPAERADVLVERFANRAGEVSKMPGFEAFELLRPTDDREVFLVYTRWSTEEDFQNWLNGQ